MLEIKNIITEMKNAFNALVSGWDMAKKRISELEDVINRNFPKWQKEKRMDMWVNKKRCNIHITGIPEGGEERRARRRTIWSNNHWEFLKIDRTKPHIQEDQRTPHRVNAKNSTPGHTISKHIKQKTKKSWKQPQGKNKPPYIQRNKDKNYIEFPFRIYASKNYGRRYSSEIF